MNIGDTKEFTFEQVIKHLLASDIDLPDKAGYVFYLFDEPGKPWQLKIKRVQ